jgi:hypothetical protein
MGGPFRLMIASRFQPMGDFGSVFLSNPRYISGAKTRKMLR